MPFLSVCPLRLQLCPKQCKASASHLYSKSLTLWRHYRVMGPSDTALQVGRETFNTWVMENYVQQWETGQNCNLKLRNLFLLFPLSGKRSSPPLCYKQMLQTKPSITPNDADTSFCPLMKKTVIKKMRGQILPLLLKTFKDKTGVQQAGKLHYGGLELGMVALWRAMAGHPVGHSLTIGQ